MRDALLRSGSLEEEGELGKPRMWGNSLWNSKISRSPGGRSHQGLPAGESGFAGRDRRRWKAGGDEANTDPTPTPQSREQEFATERLNSKLQQSKDSQLIRSVWK